MVEPLTDDDVLRLLPLQKGHFRFESGHHSDTWIDLETLCLRPEAVETLAAELSQRIAKYDVEAVCGPLVEGAFVALMVASRLRVLFTYAERFDRKTDELYPVQYRVPGLLRAELRGKRVAIINDVISAGSAVRGTLADLYECGAEPVVIGTFAVLGNTFVKQNKLPLETLISLPNEIWTPAECPFC